MATPAPRNLYLNRGDDKFYILTFTDENQEAIDITEWVVYFTVKQKLDDDDANALLTKDVSVHFDAVNGKTKIHLTNEDTDLVGNFYYDIQVKKEDDSILTIMEGMITFKQDITQRNS